MSRNTDGFDPAKHIGAMIDAALPVDRRVRPSGNFVSREEFEETIQRIRVEIENASLKTRQWVLTGVVAIILTFGSGYISLVSKLDRLNDAMPGISSVLDGRRVWMQRQDQRDDMQDEQLRTVNPKYQPLPFAETPK